MAQRTLKVCVGFTAVWLLIAALLVQPASPTLAGFTPTPARHSGGGGGGGGGSDTRPPLPSKILAEPPALFLAESPTPAAPAAPTPEVRLPETGGSPDDGNLTGSKQWPQAASVTPAPAPVAEAQPQPVQDAPPPLPATLQLAALPPALSGGEVLFHDGFLPGGRVWKTNLVTQSEAEPLTRDGMLHLSVDETRPFAWASSGKLFQGDIAVEVDADEALSDSSDYSCSLLARFVDAFNFYEFEVAADGSFSIWKVADGDTVPLIPRTPSPALLSGVAKNRLSLVVAGPAMIFGANGYQLATVIDAAHSQGDIGLVVRGEGQTKADVAFDNVEVRRLNLNASRTLNHQADAPELEQPSPTASPEVATSNLVIATPNPAIVTPNPDIATPNPVVATPKPAKVAPEPAIATPNPAILQAAVTTPAPQAMALASEWTPPPFKATLVIVNESNGEVWFSMGDQERRMPAHSKAFIVRDAGPHGFTVTDPRFQPYHGECTLAGDSIYYWYTDDSMVSDRCVRIGP